MNTIFFEWSDVESQVYHQAIKPTVPVDHSIDFVRDPFSLGEVYAGFDNVSIFVGSVISDDDLRAMRGNGVQSIALRCAGFNMLNVDLAKSLGMNVTRVASYSPESIAEHAFALLGAVTRNIMVDRRKHLAMQDGRDSSQLGFTLNGKTIGFYGLGKIGVVSGRIAKGYGMDVQYFDPFADPSAIDPTYRRVDTLDELFATSKVVSIHAPLNPQTRHTVNHSKLDQLKGGVLINTARGGIVNTTHMLEALDAGVLRGVGLDVVRGDDSYAHLPPRDNIVMTQHTAFFTQEAVQSILEQTFENLTSPKPENVL